MKKRHCPDVNRAKIIVGTAHKSKGLEYEQVIILDDYLTPTQLRGLLSRKKITPREYNQEINLLYVANARPNITLSISQPPYDYIADSSGQNDRAHVRTPI